MPTDRDRETARRIAGPCWYATSDDPNATCAAVGAPDHCVQCVETDAIAAALADARREERVAEREANCRAMCMLCRGAEPLIHAMPTHDPNDADGYQWWHAAERGSSLPCRAAAIRAREGGA